MNPDVVADTNAVLWLYFDPSRLSAPARPALHAASTTGRIYISAITMVELVYLEARSGFPYPGAFTRFSTLAADLCEPLKILPVTVQIASAMIQVPRAEIPGNAGPHHRRHGRRARIAARLRRHRHPRIGGIKRTRSRHLVMP